MVGGLQAAGEFQIHYRRFRILGIGAACRQNLSQPHYSGTAFRLASAVINKNPVTRAHVADGFHRLRIGNPVPQCALFALEII